MSDYRTRQAQRDAQHQKDYATWVAGMTPKERARLGDLGLDRPLPADYGSLHSGMNGDIAESPLASEEPDIEELIEPPAPASKEISGDALWDALRRLIGEILTLPNRSLTVECLAVVSGLSYAGDSMTDIAKRHCVTRAAVSKRCVELTEKLSLMPSRAMRTLTARKSYRAAQLRVRARYEK